MKNNGITLIALIVTIVVLIILAGVSINLILGDNGIITKAKQGKENYLVAVNEEQQILANLEEGLEIFGTSTPKEKSDIEKYRDAGTYMTEKTTLKDSNNNLIVVPEGFKIAEDSGTNITEGIVIEDNDIKTGIGNDRGNQYVWIPVGTELKKNNGTTVDIILGRYEFADGTNHKADNGTTVLERGTPILMQHCDDYANETEIHVTNLFPTSTNSYSFKELKDYRAGLASSGTDGLNATALNLKEFIDSAKSNGGYYLARYEASYGIDGKANSKVSDSYTTDNTSYPNEEGQLWANITQINASVASINLYTTVNSDLINSYAWDTAILYIQKFSGDIDYSMQDGSSINKSISNTGTNGDEVCKINDMASNIAEWSTEYCNYTTSGGTLPCTINGGSYSASSHGTNWKLHSSANFYSYLRTFRTIIYM